MKIPTLYEPASFFIKNNPLLLLIFLLGLFLRIYNLGAESIWYDEAVSAAASRLGFIAQIRWNLAESDNNPPLYYAFLHVWGLIFGDSEFALRLPSAIFGSFCVLLVYIIGNLLFNKKAGVLAALILAVSVFHIKFSQEARAYSMAVLLTLISFYFFLKLISRGKRIDSAGYVISSVLLIYTHYYGLFIIVSQNIYILSQYLMRRKSGAPDYKKWIKLELILAILYIPGLYFLYCHSIGIRKGFWLSPPTSKVLIDCFDLYSGSTSLLILFTLLSVFSVINILGMGGKGPFKGIFKTSLYEPDSRNLSYSNAVGLLLLWLFIPIAVPSLVSLLTTPIFFYRYTIVGSLAFYLLASAGVAGTNNNRFILPVAGLIVILSFPNILGYYERIDKPEWRDGISYIESNAGSGDVIVLYPDYETSAAAYYSLRDDLTLIPLTDEFFRGADAGKEYWLVMCDRWKDDIGNTKGLIEGKLRGKYDVLSRKDYEYLSIYRLKKKQGK